MRSTQLVGGWCGGWRELVKRVGLESEVSGFLCSARMVVRALALAQIWRSRGWYRLQQKFFNFCF
jgi:hypothetical protein